MSWILMGQELSTFEKHLTSIFHYDTLFLLVISPTSGTLIQRGGGNGPMKPRQPKDITVFEGANSDRMIWKMRGTDIRKRWIAPHRTEGQFLCMEV